MHFATDRVLFSVTAVVSTQRYYDGFLYLMNILHCSGGFRIIAPETADLSGHHTH